MDVLYRGAEFMNDNLMTSASTYKSLIFMLF